MTNCIILDIDSPSVKEIRSPSPRDLENLSKKWKVTSKSLEKLGMAVCNLGWLFPMWDAQGKPMGYRIRWFKGAERLSNYFRVTVGTPDENSQFLTALRSAL